MKMPTKKTATDSVKVINYQWISVQSSMLMSAGFSALSATAFKTYIVIKMYVNYSSGIAFPSLKTIADRAGMSLSQVQRSIKALELAGYLIKERAGRKSRYSIIERTTICNDWAQPTYAVSWVFRPASHAAVRAELKQLAECGTQGEFRHLQIQKIQATVSSELGPAFEKPDALQIKRKLDASTSLTDQALARIYDALQAKEDA